LLSGRNFWRHERELTKHRDRINAERRRLPMVKIEKNYVFEGRNGKRNLKDLFEARRPLTIYHFMFENFADSESALFQGLSMTIGRFFAPNRPPSILRDRTKMRIGDLLTAFTAEECANYLTNAGYAST
jgi:hypothetical protein